MPTSEEAAHVARAARDALAKGGPHRSDWPASVRVRRVSAAIEGGVLVVRVRFEDDRFPEESLGAAFEVTEIFWEENGGVLDATWAASHVFSSFDEATFAGGNPRTWEPDNDGVRWYRDQLL